MFARFLTPAEAEAAERERVRKLQSRGFQTNLTRGFDGRVRSRA